MPDMHDVVAPIPGLVATVNVKPGSKVGAGDTVALLQSMKMEIPITAEASGVVEEVLVQEGQEVDIGAVIARLRG